jgi:hypothetical protein
VVGRPRAWRPRFQTTTTSFNGMKPSIGGHYMDDDVTLPLNDVFY